MENDPKVTPPSTETTTAAAVESVPVPTVEPIIAAETSPGDEVPLEPSTAKLPPIAEPPSAAAQPVISDSDALTASQLVRLLSEAEERGYMRARRELTASNAPTGTHPPLWSNPRRVEAEAESTIEIGDEFLSTIRPTIWD